MTRQYIPIADIMRVLRQYPNGVTARELAGRFGLKPKLVASRLSKAFLYGKGVEREFRRRESGGRECLWRTHT